LACDQTLHSFPTRRSSDLALDAIDMFNALGNQNLAFPADATAVFFLWAWCIDHSAYPRLSTLESQQCSDQSLTIQSVRLRSPAPDRKSTRLNSSHVKTSYA